MEENAARTDKQPDSVKQKKKMIPKLQNCNDVMTATKLTIMIEGVDINSKL